VAFPSFAIAYQCVHLWVGNARILAGSLGAGEASCLNSFLSPALLFTSAQGATSRPPRWTASLTPA
jgi:hypothetical protein